MKRFSIEIDGKLQEVLAQKIGGQLWVHVNGKTFDFRPAMEDGGGTSGQVKEDPSMIQAPMPGKIMKIMCSVGDQVQEGQTLVAMEAMKSVCDKPSIVGQDILKIGQHQGKDQFTYFVHMKCE